MIPQKQTELEIIRKDTMKTKWIDEEGAKANKIFLKFHTRYPKTTNAERGKTVVTYR